MGCIVGVPEWLAGAHWTSFTASGDTNIIYVSSSTGNNGTAVVGDITKPYQTLAAAVVNLRDGFPDWILLKKGDFWKDEKFGYVSASGRSADEPQIFGSYDLSQPGVVNPSVAKDRPLIKGKWDAGTNPDLGALNGTQGDYRAVIGLEFYDYTRDPNNVDYNFATVGNEHSPIVTNLATNWLLIEDCKISFYGGLGLSSPYADNVANAPKGTVILRRNVIANNYQIVSAGHGVGLFAQGITLFTIEENIFDNNGWNASVSGAEANGFSHNVYLGAYNGQPTIRGNISTRSSSIGLQIRPAGQIYNNFLAQNPVGILTRIYPANCYDNVVTEGIDRGIAGVANSWGIVLSGAGNGSNYHDNIVSNAIAPSPDLSFEINVFGPNAIIALSNASPCVASFIPLNDQGRADIIVQNGDVVSFSVSGGTLPSPLVAGTNYYVVGVSANGLVFNIAATSGGTPINTTTSGSGTFSITVKTFNNLVINNIIYHWDGAPIDNGIGSITSPNALDQSGYPDPTRTIGSYASSLGLTGTIDGFMAVALLMHKDNWNPALTADAIVDYVQTGFGLFGSTTTRRYKYVAFNQ